MPGLMRGRWELLTAVVHGRRVRRSVREQLQVCTSALLYPISKGLAIGLGFHNGLASIAPAGDMIQRMFKLETQGVGHARNLANLIMALLDLTPKSEANRARSRADFKNKIKICESEASETQYWIEVIVTAKWLSREQVKIEYEECSELLAIFSSIGKSM